MSQQIKAVKVLCFLVAVLCPYLKPREAIADPQQIDSKKPKGTFMRLGRDWAQRPLSRPDFSRYDPKKGDDRSNLNALQYILKSYLDYDGTLGREALALLSISPGDHSQSLLLEIARASRTAFLFPPLNKLHAIKELDFITSEFQRELQQRFPKNLHVWDLILDDWPTEDNKSQRFREYEYIWKHRGSNPFLKANEDSILYALFYSGLFAGHESSTIAVQTLRMTGGLVARGERFFEDFPRDIISLCARSSDSCSEEIITSLSNETEEFAKKPDFAKRPYFSSAALTLSAIARAMDDSALKSLSSSLSEEDRIAAKIAHIMRNYVRPLFLAFEADDRAHLLAFKGELERLDILPYLSNDEKEEITESMPSLVK